jgi:hypothetical protein
MHAVSLTLRRIRGRLAVAEIDKVAEVSPAWNVSAANCAAVPVQVPVPEV